MKISIRIKVIALIALVALFCYFTVTFVGGNLLKYYFLNKSADELIHIRDLQEARIKDYFSDIKKQMTVLSENTEIIEILEKHSLAGDIDGSHLNATDVAKLPTPGKKDNPGQIKKIIATYQIEDVLLINMKYQNSIYSISMDGLLKEQDNLLNDLNDFVKYFKSEGAKGQWPQVYYEELPQQDFENRFAYFLAPVVQHENMIGVLVLKISSRRMNEIMTFQKKWDEYGLGKTGESYLHSSKGRLCSMPRFPTAEYFSSSHWSGRKIYEVLNVDHSGVLDFRPQNNAGKSHGIAAIEEGYSCAKVLSVYKPLTIHNLNWTIRTEQDLDEVLAPLNEFKKRAFLVVFSLVAVFGFIAIMISEMHVRKIIRLCGFAREITRGNLNVNMNIKSRDEIGKLARLFNRMAETLRVEKGESQDKQEQLETANQKLKDTYSQLVMSEKMATIGGLMAGIAHEINNPMNYIQNGVEALNSSAESMEVHFRNWENNIKPSADEVRQDIQVMKRMVKSVGNGSDRVTKIVSSLLNFSHSRKGEFMELDVHEVINSTIVIIENKIKQSGQLIVNQKAIPHVFGNFGQLSQVFINLLNNASHAIMERFDESEALTKGAIIIEADVVNSGNNVRVRVADNGKGIPEKMKNKIFDPFFTTKEVGEGTGLGLSISFSIIEAHNGIIRVSEADLDFNGKPERFTIFDILLPVQNFKHVN